MDYSSRLCHIKDNNINNLYIFIHKLPRFKKYKFKFLSFIFKNSSHLSSRISSNLLLILRKRKGYFWFDIKVH